MARLSRKKVIEQRRANTKIIRRRMKSERAAKAQAQAAQRSKIRAQDPVKPRKESSLVSKLMMTLFGGALCASLAVRYDGSKHEESNRTFFLKVGSVEIGFGSKQRVGNAHSAGVSGSLKREAAPEVSNEAACEKVAQLFEESGESFKSKLVQSSCNRLLKEPKPSEPVKKGAS